LNGLVGALSSDHRRELIAKLDALDRGREPFALKWERQRAYTNQTDWQAHLRELIAEWRGEEWSLVQNAWEWKAERSNRSLMHLLMTDLALQSYCLDHGRPPESLGELVPQYLDDVLVDVLAEQPLAYRREGDAYRVWSVGWNLIDDGGVLDDPNGNLNGDFVAIGPHMRPLPYAVRAWLASARDRAGEWLSAAAAAAWDAARPTAD
jgi:hypothetical protein